MNYTEAIDKAIQAVQMATVAAERNSALWGEVARAWAQIAQAMPVEVTSADKTVVIDEKMYEVMKAIIARYVGIIGEDGEYPVSITDEEVFHWAVKDVTLRQDKVSKTWTVRVS